MKASALLLAGFLTASATFFLHSFDTRPGPRLWSVAMADTIMKRNPGTPQDSLTRWSYWKGYTLNGFEMLGRFTGEQKYFDFIKREIDPFIDKRGNLVNVNLDSLDNV